MSVAFGKFLYSTGVMPFFPVARCIYIYLCHKKLGRSLSWLHHRTFDAFFKDFPKAELLNDVEKFFDRHLEKLFYLPAKRALLEAQEKGEQLAIMSSSPDFIVEPLAKRLKVPFWVGTCYAVNREGRLSQVAQVVDGEYKANYLNQLITRFQLKQEDITVYTDSILDLPLLLKAGHKVAVKPDRKLRALCQQNHWKML